MFKPEVESDALRVSVEAVAAVADGSATYSAQDDANASFQGLVGDAEGRIDWSRPAELLARFVRAMNPWPGAQTNLPEGRGLVLLDARAAPSSVAAPLGPGVVAEARTAFRVGTGDGVLELRTVKPAGKGAMDGADFLRGARLEPGAALGR